MHLRGDKLIESDLYLQFIELNPSDTDFSDQISDPINFRAIDRNWLRSTLSFFIVNLSKNVQISIGSKSLAIEYFFNRSKLDEN